MTDFHLTVAWIGIGLGFLAGTIQGLYFHRPDWLGGYASWPRRMLRLGHVSFFGLAFINVAFALYVNHGGASVGMFFPSGLFLAGTVTMPLICYLAACHKGLRHLFVIPVLSLLLGVACILFF